MLAERLFLRACQPATLAGFCGALSDLLKTNSHLLGSLPALCPHCVMASAADALTLLHRRIVFTSMEKFDGARFRPLTGAEVKQIAGRAGRYGSRYGSGRVTCMHQVRPAVYYMGGV